MLYSDNIMGFKNNRRYIDIRNQCETENKNTGVSGHVFTDTDIPPLKIQP
jgi:hypothetical protein